MSKLALFMHAPPEHIAHVINAMCLFSGLKNQRVDCTWITMNPRNPVSPLNPSIELDKLGLTEFADSCNVSVRNCIGHVDDESSPKEEAIEWLFSGFDASTLFLHYYPPFWNPVVQVCKRRGIRVGFHVQSFSRRANDEPYYHLYPGTLQAIRDADFLTVSQQADIEQVIRTSGKSISDISVLPKSVPPLALQRATEDTDIPPEIEGILSALSPDLRTMLYVGRLERFKNIHWFLNSCMPRLENRLNEFQVLIVGRGSIEEEILIQARQFSNVRVVLKQLPYDLGLRLISLSDIILFPSGYDYSPRLPLEAILLGRPVLLGNFFFNRRYFDAAKYVVNGATFGHDVLEYSGESIEYGIPDSSEVVDALCSFLDNPRSNIDTQAMRLLARESTPLFGAKLLLEVSGHTKNYAE